MPTRETKGLIKVEKYTSSVPARCDECGKAADYVLIEPGNNIIVFKLCTRDLRSLSNRMMMATQKVTGGI